MNKSELIAASLEARNIVDIYPELSINQVLLAMYSAETGCEDFKTFKQWSDSGMQIKKGEECFRVWGRPKKTKRPSNDQATCEDEYKFWPTCCLFNELQVETAS